MLSHRVRYPYSSAVSHGDNELSGRDPTDVG